MVQININGRAHNVEAEADTPLLWALRDDLDLTGTKFGCGIAACGACTVWVDGAPTRSCQISVGDAASSRITTVEGLQGREADAIRAAWIALDVVQCGWCQSGQIMAATALLKQNPKPSDADIDAAMDGNVCRCGTYQRIRTAIHTASNTLSKG